MDLTGGADWEPESRELALNCDARGMILWADRRAQRILGAEVGKSLASLVVEGCESKLETLLLNARHERVRDWELPLRAGNVPLTISFAAQPGRAGEVMLYGCALPDGYGRTVRQLRDTLDELVDLNHGVRSLHAELEEKADSLRRAADVKSRVMANVSHEFRTPLHTILGLSKLLLDTSDGPLTDEQQKQIRFIRSSAQELSQWVNDLLDVSKTEPGRGVLRIEAVVANDLFASLRGMMRPLLYGRTDGVALHFDAPPADLFLETDQGKLAQILRNLITNALKFTEHGEVRVSALRSADRCRFVVRDTGIGIAEENYARIFEEFGQIDNPLQARQRGTGLGLPLSAKMAEALGGTLQVESVVGQGSAFTLDIPVVHPQGGAARLGTGAGNG